MDLTQQHKDELEDKIVQTIIAGLDKEAITQEQLSEISAFVLDRIDDVVFKEQLVTFLEELAGKWDIFKPLLALEHGEVKQVQESNTIESVLAMTKQGNIDQAIDLAKSATQIAN